MARRISLEKLKNWTMGIVVAPCVLACGPLAGESVQSDAITTLPGVVSTGVNATMTNGQMNTWRCGWMNFDLDGDNVSLQAGEPITDAYASWGVQISTYVNGGTPALGIVFDSANPTGGDNDLGTPSQIFGGPGVGNGGWSNSNSLYGLLIVAENTIDADGDGLVDDPDDNASGGSFKFDFDEDMCVIGTKVVDNEVGEAPANIYMRDGAQTLLAEATSSNLGNNSSEYIPLGTCGVRSLQVDLHGSGALDGTGICAGTPRSYQIEIQDTFDDVRWVRFDLEVEGKKGNTWHTLASQTFEHFPFMLTNGGALPDAPLTDAGAPTGNYSKIRIRLANIETEHYDGTVAQHGNSPYSAKINHAFNVPTCGTLDLDLDYELNIRSSLSLHEIALGLEFLAATTGVTTCSN